MENGKGVCLRFEGNWNTMCCLLLAVICCVDEDGVERRGEGS